METLKRVSELVSGELSGDPDLEITSVNSITKATSTEISFSVKDSIDVNTVQAAALIVKKGSELKYPNIIFVDSPYRAFAQLLDFFFPTKKFSDGIDSAARVCDSADIGSDVCIGAFSYIGEEASVGAGTEIHASVSIYPGVKIGKNCLIYSNVVIREGVEVGDQVIIHSGAVIGADGFGFTRDSDGIPIKIPQKGKLVIGDACEIGANTCIDRSTIEETVLKSHVKLDNLVQIGHNVTIGEGTAISSQTGISGSTVIGRGVIMGGQVGIADHVKIADGVMIAAKTGVTGSIEKRGIVAGIPHTGIREWRKNWVIFRNLESYIDRIKFLEKKVREMEEK